MQSRGSTDFYQWNLGNPHLTFASAEIIDLVGDYRVLEEESLSYYQYISFNIQR